MFGQAERVLVFLMAVVLLVTTLVFHFVNVIRN